MIVNVSEKTKKTLTEIARIGGESVADYAGFLLEEKAKEAAITPSPRKKLSDLAGMFYGGNGNTAEKASEILRSEIDKLSGFGK